MLKRFCSFNASYLAGLLTAPLIVTTFFLGSTKITSPDLNLFFKSYSPLINKSYKSNDSITALSLIRFISLKDPYLFIPPETDNACKILELPLKV